MRSIFGMEPAAKFNSPDDANSNAMLLSEVQHFEDIKETQV